MAGVPNKKSYSDVSQSSSYNLALPGIADLLLKMVGKGDGKVRGVERTVFDGSKPAQVSVQDYLIRMCKYGYCSPEVFICLLIYLGRIRERQGTVFTSYNIHRLLLTSFVVAAKLRDDTYYSNKYYASIGGVTLSDMNKMEQSFLRSTGWNLYISKAEYDKFYAAMYKARSSSTSQSSIKAIPTPPHYKQPLSNSRPTTVERHPETDDHTSTQVVYNSQVAAGAAKSWN